MHLGVAGPAGEFVHDAVAASAGVTGQEYLGDLVLVCELRESIGRAALQRGELVPLENWIPALTWAFSGFRLLARIR